MVHVMVGNLGSLYLTGMGLDNNSLMFVIRRTFLGTLVFLFLVHISFKNFAYEGICCMASRSGTLIFTIGLCTSSADFSFSFSSFSEVFGLEYADVKVSFELVFGWVVTSGEETWLSTYFPDLKT